MKKNILKLLLLITTLSLVGVGITQAGNADSKIIGSIIAKPIAQPKIREEIIIYSDTKTRAKEHSAENLNHDWINPNVTLDWPNAKVVDVGSGWSKCSYSPLDGNTIPEECYSGDIYKFFDTTHGKIISASKSRSTDSMKKYFYRKNFTLDSNYDIIDVKLYFTGDNVTKFWIDGNPTRNYTTSSLSNDGKCNSGPQGNAYGGSLNVINVTNKIDTTRTDHLLAANLVNTRPCNKSHPMGLQFFLKITYEREI